MGLEIDQALGHEDKVVRKNLDIKVRTAFFDDLLYIDNFRVGGAIGLGLRRVQAAKRAVAGAGADFGSGVDSPHPTIIRPSARENTEMKRMRLLLEGERQIAPPPALFKSQNQRRPPGMWANMLGRRPR